METEEEEAENDITCTELPEFTTVQNATDVELELDNKKSNDPLNMLEPVKQEVESAAARTPIIREPEEYKADIEDEEYATKCRII